MSTDHMMKVFGSEDNHRYAVAVATCHGLCAVSTYSLSGLCRVPVQLVNDGFLAGSKLSADKLGEKQQKQPSSVIIVTRAQ